MYFNYVLTEVGRTNFFKQSAYALGQSANLSGVPVCKTLIIKNENPLTYFSSKLVERSPENED
jgi:hypothetical protein